MADLAPEAPKKRATQRCPNCELKLDVSLYVDGSLARCGRCNVRFQVRRDDSRPPAAANPPPEQKAPVEPTPEKPLPAMEGFAVHERIGQGGMGEVFKCTRLSDRQVVAVKVLTPQMAAVPDYVRRFGREASAMAQLDHPGIVRLLGRGRSGAQCWIAMEFIEGRSLRIYAHEERPSARQLAKLLAQVAHALAYAHARGVVHRDLKPDNVLVQADLRTKVLDFGLAGLHAEGAECLTQSHVAMGTANYMAPEQRKDAKRADHRADLYSFGVMIYELLTAELPIGRFSLPSKMVSGLDPRWDVLVERCLSAEPSARPHSALEVAHALESLAGLTAQMAMPPRPARKARKSGLFSWLGIGAGVAVLIGIAGLRVAQDHDARPQLTAGRLAKRLR